MYSQGENFYFEIDGEEYDLHVLANFHIRSKEYLITEDFDGELHVFYYDEDEEDIVLLDDVDAMDIIEYWQNEYFDDDNIGDYDDDEYYEREDEDYGDRYDNEDYDENYENGYYDDEDYY